jgi:signal transduction histidine kinase
MHVHRLGFGPLARLRLPRRTARLRLTAVYGTLFVLSGAALVAVTYALFERLTASRTPKLPSIPHTPAIHALKLSSPYTFVISALPQLGKDQFLLTQDQRQLAQAIGPPGKPSFHLLAGDQRQLSKDQHQLSQAVHQLANAVHQVSQARAVEAAQRATDSHQLLVDSAIALAIVVVIAVLAGWLVAGRVLRPIRTITRTARRISSASLHERLSLEGPEDELKELGDTLDELFGRLDAAFEAQRHFVANASHELRTPITVERNLLQVALDDPSTSAATWRSTAVELLASNDEQRHLIDALLTLASSESGVEDREAVDLSKIARTVLACRDGERLGLLVDAVLDTAALEGDPRLLESLVANLVDNAMTYNVEGGRVEVRTGSTGTSGWLLVSNTGAVVPREEVDRLFQPFQRLDRRRLRRDKGHGLGLSIVQAIVTAHAASLTVDPAPDGGLSIEVRFPPPPFARDEEGRGAERVLALTD